MPTELHYSFSRSVTSADYDKFGGVRRGRIGISFSPGQYIRFCQFEFDRGSLEKEFTPPEWALRNRLVVKVYGFEPTEKLKADLVGFLGLLPNTIRTEQREILKSDSRALQRRFLNFDRVDAIEIWTVPNPKWPNVEGERLFKCWECDRRLADFCFNVEPEPLHSLFDVLLSWYVFQVPRCCSECTCKRSIPKWTASVAKRLRSE
jgi:hypothetical protein